MEYCCVCMEDKILDKLDCSHKICNNCMDQWLKKNNSCPICRKVINKKED